MKRPRPDLSCSARTKDISRADIVMLEFIRKMQIRELAAINLLDELLQIVVYMSKQIEIYAELKYNKLFLPFQFCASGSFFSFSFQRNLL
jgi:hypothetical protein